MIKASLFVLTKEKDGLVAYPIILQMPIDEAGYRYISYNPLVDMAVKPPTGLAIIHGNALASFPDLTVKDYEIAEDDENALTVVLSNMLCGTRYLYSPMTQADLEIEYEGLAKAICHLMLRLLASTPSQKGFLGALYGTFQRFLPVLNLTQVEVMDFMKVLDAIVEETINSDGFITIASVTEAMESIGTEAETYTQVDVSDMDDDDAAFFAGLFA